ncbi:MAG: septum formation initiator family protein [Clostridia bacterium]|nr:septum formation initiator family protein [Clostridia bacterium]
MDRDRKVISWRGMALIVVLMLIVFAILMHTNQKRLNALREQEAALQLTLSGMELDFSDLRSELMRVGSDGYVENEARENYGFIKEGEICFEFTNPKKLQDYTEEEWQVIMEEKLYSQ